MESLDKRAFEYMNQGDPDKYISGGAIEHSNYEMDMSPEEQEDFLRTNTKLFNNLYNADPLADKERLPFPNWLKALDEEYVMELSNEYSEKQAPRDSRTIIAKDLMDQAGKHWGGKHGLGSIKDLALGGSGAWESRETSGE